MTSSTLTRCMVGTALVAFLVALPVELSAQAPSTQDLAGLTATGSYLAARHAGQQRDAAAAAAFYRAALRRDPKNGELLDRTFLSLLVDGDGRGIRPLRRADYARSTRTTASPSWCSACMRSRKRNMPPARRELAQSMRGPITDLTATLLTAWSQHGAGDNKGAVATIDRLTGPDWYAIFKDLHAGMIAELSGNQKEAGKRFENAYKLDPTALRVVEAYGSWLSRNRSPKDALTVFETFDKQLPRHPLIVEAMNKLKAGEKLPPLVANAQAGAAEALYGLGASLGRRGGEDLGLVYLQLALYLAPTHPLALLSLADLYESLKKPELAIKIYERVPANSPLHRNAAIQMASDLDALDKSDEAQEAPDRADQATIPTISRRSWRWAMCSAGARNSPNAPTPIPRASPPSSSRSRTTGRSFISAAFATSAPSNGRRRKPISRRRWNFSPSSRRCSIISAIPGSTRASTSIRAWR